jgi:hypothetical protein
LERNTLILVRFGLKSCMEKISIRLLNTSESSISRCKVERRKRK